VNQVELDKIVEQLDTAFGCELPFSQAALAPADLAALRRVFGDAGYQDYLHDQVNRQIIRDYLVNAVMLGFLAEESLADFGRQVATREGRSTLSLHMLMTSVEHVAELAGGGSEAGNLTPLRPEPGSPPHIRLVQ
jgi:hypothetical protein